jgi:hypothetical protein
VSATRYGPSDTWPEHDDKNWKPSLAEARRAGWTLTYLNAPHRFGVVSCPAEEHTFAVGKTPKGSETMAKEAGKRVSRCEHPPSGPVQARRDQSRELLDVAEQLTREVAQGLDGVEDRLDAYRVLDRLEIQLESAASNVDEVLLAEQDAALETAIEADEAAPDPLALDEKLYAASASATQSESVAKSIKSCHPGVAKPLLERANKLHDLIGTLRSRLTILQEQMQPKSG